jgi:hypothetical protein
MGAGGAGSGGGGADGDGEAKTEFLQIRVTPEEHERIRRAAKADHLDKSTWARRVLLIALERWEESRSGAAVKKVAEPKPPKRKY